MKRTVNIIVITSLVVIAISFVVYSIVTTTLVK